MEDLLYYLLPVGLLFLVWLLLMWYGKQKRNQRRNRRRFGDRE